jgi:GrpB-like predicted nucleotidyltransferase (UPF0157 family)
MPSRTVQIVEPKPSWSSEFADIGSELQKVLGRLALRIDLIGSTAVPNLAAKDVIDIQVTVLALEESVIVGGTSRSGEALLKPKLPDKLRA